MRIWGLAIALALLSIGAVQVSAQVIDNFESGDLSAWNVEAPHYTTLSTVSPGAGGSGKALAIQETAGALGAHSTNALAHRNFQTPVDWTPYVTLEMDVQVSSPEWNGYSIRIYNDGSSVLLRGIHSDSSLSGFRTVRFDISGMPRDLITEIVIYVNKTGLDAGQTLTVDNIRLSTTPLAIDPVRVIENFSSGDLTCWTDPVSPVYLTTVTGVDENAPTDASAPAKAVSGKLNAGASSGSALFRWRPAQTMDWYGYSTLEFDAKLAFGTQTDGFSVRFYNAGTNLTVRKLVPGAASYVTCKVDISGLERDQINEVLFYINRTSANASQELRIDNIRLTNSGVPAVPDVVTIDDFDTYADDTAMKVWWNAAHSTSTDRWLETLDFVSSPQSLNIMLRSGLSSSAYATRSCLNPITGKTQDWGDYKSIMFEAKAILPSPEVVSYPIGFSTNVVSGPASSQLWFMPSQFSTDTGNWETIAVDISKIDTDQVSLIRLYHNRCLRNDLYEVLRVDNVRLSKEPAPPVNFANPDIDDFEDGDIADWYYTSYHEYPDGSGTYLDGTTHALSTDASTGQYALCITPLNPPGSTSAYCRKTVHANWSGYKTLVFDAKVVGANTSEGFSVRLRDFGGYRPQRTFYPTAQWQTFKIDISQDTRTEVIGLLFYVNMSNSFNLVQTGTLLVDNIHLTNETVNTTFDKIGDLQSIGDGYTITLNGKVCAGQFLDAVPDRTNSTIRRTIVFLEEDDRSAAVPVVLGPDTGITELASGTRVNVTGLLTHGMGLRYIYATGVTPAETGVAIPAPVGLTNRACGDQDGVEGFAGLRTTGLLSVVAGKVVGVGGPDALGHAYLYIDDGSGVESDNGQIGIQVIDLSDMGGWADLSNIGRYVRVTGFVVNTPEVSSTTRLMTGRTVRAIWPKAELTSAIEWIE